MSDSGYKYNGDWFHEVDWPHYALELRVELIEAFDAQKPEPQWHVDEKISPEAGAYAYMGTFKDAMADSDYRIKWHKAYLEAQACFEAKKEHDNKFEYNSSDYQYNSGDYEYVQTKKRKHTDNEEDEVDDADKVD